MLVKFELLIVYNVNTLNFIWLIKGFVYTSFVVMEHIWLSGNFWLVSFKISYLCLPLFYETRTTPSCHPSGCAYRQL